MTNSVPIGNRNVSNGTAPALGGPPGGPPPGFHNLNSGLPPAGVGAVNTRPSYRSTRGRSGAPHRESFDRVRKPPFTVRMFTDYYDSRRLEVKTVDWRITGDPRAVAHLSGAEKEALYVYIYSFSSNVV